MHENKKGAPLLVAQIEPPQDGTCGDYYYRTHAPGVAMAQEEGVHVVTLTNLHRRKDEIVSKADILVLKNICDPDFLPLIQQRKQRGQLTVYEMADDLAAIPEWNPVHFFYSNQENVDLVYLLARYCDAIQFSVPQLQRAYGHLNQHTAVFPNQILEYCEEVPVSSSEEVVVGWGGSHGHLKDIAEIAGPLSQWIMNQQDAKLHLMCSNPIWRLFDHLPAYKKRRTVPGSIEEYRNFLRQIDIGVAPLMDTPFNRSRSDVKFLEYASFGVVPVLACLEPYIESVEDSITGFLYRNTDELIEILNRLAKNRTMREDVGANAREYVVTCRNQMDYGECRTSYYMNLVKTLSYGTKPEDWLEHWEEWRGMSGVWGHRRYLKLFHTDFERLLHDGLIRSQVEGDKAAAMTLFNQAAVSEPRNYLPHLFNASVLEDPVKSLKEALRLAPNSVKTLILLGEALGRQGKPRQALESFSAAACLFPNYDVPYCRAAEILSAIGQNSQAELLIERAKMITPYLFFR